MPQKSQPVRMKMRTITALTKIAGLMQRETGRHISADSAAWASIQKAFPNIAAEVIEEFGDVPEEEDDDEE